MAFPYRTVHIKMADYRVAIERWSTILERTHSWEMPQRVTIGAYDESTIVPEHDMIKAGDSQLRASIRSCKSQLPDQGFQAQVLIDFLRRLPSLADLVWQVSTPLGPLLVQFLRDQLRGCNLHLEPFHIPHDADPSYMRSVLCLPSLQTIWLERDQNRAFQDLVHHAIWAPKGNLRKLRVLWSPIRGATFAEEGQASRDQEPTIQYSQRIGQLRCLQIVGVQYEKENSLPAWARYTDFSQLRALSLEMPVTQAALKTLIGLPLSSLDSLGFILDPHDTSDYYNATLQAFICNLSGLSHLRLKGGLPEAVIENILNHLGPSLQTLYLIPEEIDFYCFVFDSNTIATVTDSCKQLQDLGITVRRKWSKLGEDIAILKAIGSMPCLSRVTLYFDASDHTLLRNSDVEGPTDLAPSDPSFSAFDNEPFSCDFGTTKSLRNGHIRDALINAAIDANLAQAVFDTIESAAPDGQSASLQYLSLKAAKGGNFGTGSVDISIEDVVAEIGREWIVKRSEDRPSVDVRRAEVDDTGGKLMDWLAWHIEPVFRKIWPGDGDWYSEWQAFPLA